MPRKFHRTVIQIEVLAEIPYAFDSFEQLAYDVIEGDCSGEVLSEKAEVIDGKKMAELLIAQGSSTTFFGIDENGDECERC